MSFFSRTRRLRAAHVATGALLTLCAAAAGIRAQDDPPGPAAAGALAAFPLEFDSEAIHLRVVGDSVEVDGTYWLVCHAAAGTTHLVYPFPADPRMGGARAVRMEVRAPAGPWIPLEHDMLPNGAACRFQVPLLAVDTLEFHAVYRQALLENYARYIVTTTRAWGKPLRRALFTITLPPGAEILKASYAFTPAEAEACAANAGGRAPAGSAASAARTAAPEPEQAPGSRCYSFQARMFWPAEDILVEWSQ
ncbi:MAG: hypothetical protein V1774_06375 [Candidatus Eisenbacteria bacterium]